MEWLTKQRPTAPVTDVVFDFDGTISTIRHSWETVMEPFMVETIEGSTGSHKLTRPLSAEDIRAMVHLYVEESTGIQTIMQMKWLAEKVRTAGTDTAPINDPWVYKTEYNRRLMISVRERLELINKDKSKRADYMIRGSRELLESLAGRGVRLFLASGTDDCDVRNEVRALGLDHFFTEIKGAQENSESCSKEAVIRALIHDRGVPGSRLAVVGDGKVEIMVGRENGTRTLGVASDEEGLEGVNQAKRARLMKAGADAITGDFLDISELSELFFCGKNGKDEAHD